MNETPAAFFAELHRSADEALLRKAAGTVRFELEDGNKTERWLLRIDKGGVAVSRKNAAADCVVRADRELVQRVAAGELNAFTAMLRGEIVVEGDFRLLLLVQRLFADARATAMGAS